jgi:hypothetical protein
MFEVLNIIWVNLIFMVLRACLISGFRHDVNETFGLLGCYAAYNGSYLPKFRDNLLVPSGPIFKGQAVQAERFALLDP